MERQSLTAWLVMENPATRASPEEGGNSVGDDTIVVAFYIAPLAKELRPHFENLPAQLEAEGIKPEIP